MEYQETELNEGMIERLNEIEHAVYDLLLCLLQIEPSQAEKEFPWNLEIIREVLSLAIEVLGNYGKAVCNPYRATSGERSYLCMPIECGCEKCHYQENFMIKDMILSCIDEVLKINGYRVMDGDSDSVIVRDKKAENDFQISVKEIVE